jgi:hypothetical protein
MMAPAQLNGKEGWMAKKVAAATKRQRTMSEEHKAALADGREQGRVVRRYLEALESHRPKRGRKRTPESITKRLAAIEERIATADPLSRLHLLQERMDLEYELAGTEGDGAELDELEAAFVQVASAYGERKGLTYEAWRSIGLEPRVLKAAGIGRGQ